MLKQSIYSIVLNQCVEPPPEAVNLRLSASIAPTPLGEKNLRAQNFSSDIRRIKKEVNFLTGGLVKHEHPFQHRVKYVYRIMKLLKLQYFENVPITLFIYKGIANLIYESFFCDKVDIEMTRKSGTNAI